MKRKTLRWSFLTSVGFLVVGMGLTGCGSDSGIFESASVKLNKSKLQLSVGETSKLIASVTKGYNSELRWFTSNESIAAVDEGYVFAVGEGQCTVTAAYAGGYADCTIIVGEGQGGEAETNKLTLSTSTMKLKPGDSQTLRVSGVAPAGTTATFTSSNTSIVTAEDAADGLSSVITAVAVGTASITVAGSNGITRVCQVTVSEESSGPSGYDIAVETNLGYSGALKIGTPKNQRTFMNTLLDKFNEFTGSNISFTLIDFEEDNGTTGFKDASGMPAIFPYASDQTMTLSQFKALSYIPYDYSDWIEENMGEAALEAASLDRCVGYPFAADNGLVMFYNKNYVSPEDIDTVDELLAKAEELDMEINYPLNNGFYIAPALMSFNNGKALYEVTPTNDGYTAKSTFNSANGIKGAKLVKAIADHDSMRNATDAPRNGVLVTITDSSKVQNFKTVLADNYGVAPLPYTDSSKTSRLGSFLGYKFYGVNQQLSADDKAKANDIAKFLCSEYAQYQRFTQYNVRPTLIMDKEKLDGAFVDSVLAEPHIQALTVQSQNGGVIPMKAVSSGLWDYTRSAYYELKDLSATAADSEYVTILKNLDSNLKK